MCQLDALQRLKPDRTIIESALENLPRTLDETYERVFQRIPEESRSFVQHVLQWLCTHQSLHQAIPGVERTLSCSFAPVDIPHGLDIPCDVLFQAVQQSLAGEDSSESLPLSTYALDPELLRELCGCLVTVTDYPVGPPSEIEDMPVVSFAHYSVLEFLESARIRSGPAARFALEKERVMVEHALILLHGATASAKRWNGELPRDPGSDFYADFDRYCAHSSVLLLHWRAGILPASSTTAWMAPVVQLLDTRVPDVGSYFWYTPEALHCLQHPITPAIQAFRQILTLRLLTPPAQPHLRTLVSMLQLDGGGYLARNLLATLGRTSSDLALPLDLGFRPSVFYTSTERRMSQEEFDALSETVCFRGSVLEFHAHFPPATSLQSGQSLYELLAFAEGHFDPSRVMLLAVRKHRSGFSHSRSRCFDCLVLMQLLRLGAQSTVPGFAVGSLQIAVALGDAEITLLLLEAGVDANDIGDPEGEIGTPETGPMLRRFQCIRGRSPLNIAKGGHLAALRATSFDCGEHSSGADAKIEPLLIRYGGRDFSTASADEDVSLADKLERVSISDGGVETISVIEHEAGTGSRAGAGDLAPRDVPPAEAT